MCPVFVRFFVMNSFFICSIFVLFIVDSLFLVFLFYCGFVKCNYTEQKKKCNNYISLNFEQTMIQSEIIAFSTSALDIRLTNARNRFSF